MNKDEALKLALEALEFDGFMPEDLTHRSLHAKAITAIKQARSAPVQQSRSDVEPVAWISHNAGLYHFKPDESLDPMPLYTTPPAAKRPWVGLMDEEIKITWRDIDGSEGMLIRFARAIEAKLKEKNQ